MGIFYTLNSKPDQPGLGHEFPATAGKRFVDWAEFIAAEPHDSPPEDGWMVKSAVGWRSWGGNLSTQTGCHNSCKRETMSKLANVVQQLQKERDQARRRVEQLDEALKALGSLGGLRGGVGRVRRAQTVGKKRRTMSAAARKRIAAAQRARWAKWKAARRSK
jgi:hypothetical protein